jgi:hypothetical protein
MRRLLASSRMVLDRAPLTRPLAAVLREQTRAHQVGMPMTAGGPVKRRPTTRRAGTPKTRGQMCSGVCARSSLPSGPVRGKPMPRRVVRDPGPERKHLIVIGVFVRDGSCPNGRSCTVLPSEAETVCCALIGCTVRFLARSHPREASHRSPPRPAPRHYIATTLRLRLSTAPLPMRLCRPQAARAVGLRVPRRRPSSRVATV